MKMKLIALLGVILILSCGVLSENDTFVPTKEWQEIKEGQSIPRGLHVRMDLTTGKKEAKILDESADDDEETPSAAMSNKPTDNRQQQQQSLSLTDEDVLKRLSIEFKPDDMRGQYKSYKELKKSYEDIKSQFKSDAEIINGLIEKYNKLMKHPEDLPKKGAKGPSSQIVLAIEAILEDLKTLVHQIDNAQWFVDAGGLDQILHPIVVNETNISLKVHAMRVLGALTQNNPKTQVEVFKRNFGSHLAQILISSTNTEELSAALYAFGALLRKFPHAQERIFSTSGIQGLIAVLAKECELRLKAKAATLINDVIVEKQLVLKETAETGDRLAAAQYVDLDFPAWLQTNAYCDTMDSLISTSLYGLLEQPDTTEYFIETLHSTVHICEELWSQSPQMRHTLLTISNRYKRSDDNYQHELSAEMQKVIRILYPDTATRDEL